MLEVILQMIPWELVIYSIIEYIMGRTDWVQANSVLELIINIILKILKKRDAI